MLCCCSLAQTVWPLFKLKQELQPATYLKEKDSFPSYNLPAASFPSPKKKTVPNPSSLLSAQYSPSMRTRVHNLPPCLSPPAAPLCVPELGQSYQHTGRDLSPSSLFSFATFRAASLSIAQLQVVAKDSPSCKSGTQQGPLIASCVRFLIPLLWTVANTIPHPTEKSHMAILIWW